MRGNGRQDASSFYDSFKESRMLIRHTVRKLMLIAAVALGASLMTSPAVAFEDGCDPITAIDAQTGEEIECSWCESEEGCSFACENGDHGSCGSGEN